MGTFQVARIALRMKATVTHLWLANLQRVDVGRQCPPTPTVDDHGKFSGLPEGLAAGTNLRAYRARAREQFW